MKKTIKSILLIFVLFFGIVFSYTKTSKVDGYQEPTTHQIREDVEWVTINSQKYDRYNDAAEVKFRVAKGITLKSTTLVADDNLDLWGDSWGPRGPLDKRDCFAKFDFDSLDDFSQYHNFVLVIHAKDKKGNELTGKVNLDEYWEPYWPEIEPQASFVFTLEIAAIITAFTLTIFVFLLQQRGLK